MVYRSNKMEGEMFFGMETWEFLLLVGFTIVLLWDSNSRKNLKGFKRFLRRAARDLESRR